MSGQRSGAIVTGQNDRPPSTVYRMPLDGGRPRAVRASGAPLDQFSFREDRRRGRLEVVVQSDDGGDAMWEHQGREGTVALLSLPLGRFGDGAGVARPGEYRPLPGLPEDGWQRQNRFVGDYLLYAVDRPATDGEDRRRTGVLMTMRVGDGQTRTFDLAAPVSRIEGLGPDALIVTSGEQAMTLTVVEQDGRRPELGARYTVPGAGEIQRPQPWLLLPSGRPGRRSRPARSADPELSRAGASFAVGGWCRHAVRPARSGFADGVGRLVKTGRAAGARISAASPVWTGTGRRVRSSSGGASSP